MILESLSALTDNVVSRTRRLGGVLITDHPRRSDTRRRTDPNGSGPAAPRNALTCTNGHPEVPVRTQQDPPSCGHNQTSQVQSCPRPYGSALASGCFSCPEHPLAGRSAGRNVEILVIRPVALCCRVWIAPRRPPSGHAGKGRAWRGERREQYSVLALGEYRSCRLESICIRELVTRDNAG